MDIYNVLSVLLATVQALEVCGVSARYRKLEVVPSLNNLTLRKGSVCGQERFLSWSSRTQILFLYNGALVTDPCVLHITNTDSNWHSMICIEIHERPNFDCMQIFKFYFGEYPPEISSTENYLNITYNGRGMLRYATPQTIAELENITKQSAKDLKKIIIMVERQCLEVVGRLQQRGKIQYMYMEKLLSCNDIRQRLCKTDRSTHIIFNASAVSDQTSRIKFKIEISITNRIDKRSSPDSWSSWNNWSSWSPSWSSWNDWSSWSALSSNHEKEEEKRKGGAGISILLLCVFGLILLFIVYVMCCKWILKKHRPGNHDSVSAVQTPQYSTVSENRALHSEVQTHNRTRASDVNASMSTEVTANNDDINRLPNRGQEDVYLNHFTTIASLIEDYIASRDHHSHTDREMLAESSCQVLTVPVSTLSPSSEPTLSNEDTCMTSHHGPSASSTRHPSTITSLHEGYLATREHHETSGGQVTPSTRAAVNDSVTMQATLSTADTSFSSQHEPSVTCNVSRPTITSLIEEYNATRNHPQAADQSTTASLPTTQAIRVPSASTNVTESCITSAHANISATAGLSPTISSLIEEYFSTRTSRIPSEQRHGHSPVQDNQPTSLEPPQYAEVISGRILVSVEGATAATNGGNFDDIPPPSYESLYGESESRRP